MPLPLGYVVVAMETRVVQICKEDPTVRQNTVHAHNRRYLQVSCRGIIQYRRSGIPLWT